MDSKGLVCKSRTDLQDHKIAFAHEAEHYKDLLSAVKALRPTILIGVSTMAGSFTREVLETMASLNEYPIIFPLSNPTSKAECTFSEALEATKGRVLFASGSPFPPCTYDGVERYPAQANNAYIFPCMGAAAMLCKCSYIPDAVFLKAAYKLAEMSSMEDMRRGRLFPAFAEIQNISAVLGGDVLEYMCSNGLGTLPGNVRNYEDYYRSKMWNPTI
jgi:malate dehydrogenase (oxaloacetate-decarboxylating)(NADP+)